MKVLNFNLLICFFILAIAYSTSARRTFHGKVVLISDATSKIGREIATDFAANGAKLALIANDNSTVLEVGNICELISPLKHKHLMMSGNLSDMEFLQNAVEATIEHYSRVDIFISNAGIMYRSEPNDRNFKHKFNELFNVNLRSFIYLTTLLAPHLEASKGSIVTMSSTTAFLTIPLLRDYSLTKLAIIKATETFARELGPRGIRVNCVATGWLTTIKESTDRIGLDDLIISRTPLRRLARVEDITNALMFLCSEEASYITGACLPVDGGHRLAGLL